MLCRAFFGGLDQTHGHEMLSPSHPSIPVEKLYYEALKIYSHVFIKLFLHGSNCVPAFDCIGRSGGFGDWEGMKDRANPNLCLHEGCVSVKSIYMCTKQNCFFTSSSFYEILK